MTTHRRAVITIVTESILEARLTRDLEHLGAPGYTITDARGRGHRGVRTASTAEGGNIRCEVVCSGDVADRIIGHLRETYYEHFAMIVFRGEVSVLRPDKFE